MTQLEPTPKQEIRNIVDYIKLDTIQESAERTLGDGGRDFLTSIISLANSNPAIMECEPRSVYTACLASAAVGLPVNANLGWSYIIPYYNNKTKQKEAQFQMGYKGFIQIAMRSGEFISIGAREVYKDQLTGFDNFNGEPQFNFNTEEALEISGYMAYIELKNGFRKAFYMTTEKVQEHAKEYSQSYRKNQGPWKDNFDSMAKKTVLKLLLSKYAPASIESLHRAVQEDQKVGEVYADNKIAFDVQNAAIEGETIEEHTGWACRICGKADIKTNDDDLCEECETEVKAQEKAYRDELPDVADTF